jgi:glycerol-1-phosphate dehydrogenase [NAD(P)+]
LNNWNRILDDISPYLLPSETIRTALEEAGGATKLVDIHRTEEEVIQALLYGSHYRPRYTILDLFWELGLFPDIVPEILKQAQV